MSEEKELEFGVIEVAGKEYQLIKKGVDQAEQVVQFGMWLSEYGMPAFDKLGSLEGDVSNEQMLQAIFSSLSADALVSLFAVIIGCSKATAKKEFDIGILLDAIMIVWDNQPGIRSTVQRFFSMRA